MARIRTIKPEFWSDETVGEVSPTARLLFVGTWNLADDHGNLERSSRQLKAQLFPYDAFDCEPYVQELLRVGLLIEYEVDGRKYLHIKGFDKHQKVEKKSSPRHPLYDESARAPGSLPDSSPTSSGSSLGREGKGMETITEGTRASVEPSPKSPKPEPNAYAAMSIALRKVGVNINSIHPVLCAWVDDGYTIDQVLGAVAIARETKGDNERLPPNYLDTILRAPKRQNGNGRAAAPASIPARLTTGEIIEQAIRDGRSDEQIAAMPELDLVPELSAWISEKREEVRRAEH